MKRRHRRLYRLLQKRYDRMTSVLAVAVRKQRIVTVLKQGTINKRNLKTDYDGYNDYQRIIIEGE